MQYDVFISHASEDKKSFVEPLANALKNTGLKVRYDRSELTLGDCLHESSRRKSFQEYGLQTRE